MKQNYLLAIFFILIYTFSVSCNTTAVKTSATKKTYKPYYEGYFYLQRLYPGIAALDNLKFSSERSKLRYFTLNEKFIYFSKNSRDKLKIKGGIKLKRILDKRNDVTMQGKCCSNLKYVDFTPKKSENPKNMPLFTNKTSNKKMSFRKANYCLEIFAAFRARWRLCAMRPIDSYRLQLKIVFSLIKTTVDLKKTKAPLVIEKFLTNSKLAPDPINANWNWSTQKKWEGKCKSKYMQSPIKIEEEKTSTSQVPGFTIKYNLLNTHIEVVRRFNEIVIQFKNDPGLMMIEYEEKRIVFKPTYISFRFPGEHSLLGKRYSGDMLIHCDEVSLDKVKRTNGLIFTIPLDAKAEYSNFKAFEKLAIDFWKYMVLKKGSYQPKNFLTKKPLVLQLKDLMREVVGMKPIYYFYLGSSTVPPCEEYAYQLIIGKPVKISNCQFKILRENSLASNENRQIHSRLTQINNPDDYDDGGSDEGDANDGSDGGSSSGRSGAGIGKGGIMAIHSLTFDSDLDQYIDDDDLRRRLGLKRLKDGGRYGKNGKRRRKRGDGDDDDWDDDGNGGRGRRGGKGSGSGNLDDILNC